MICTGSSELSVLDLCKRIMRSVKNDPAGLLSQTAGDFCRYPGIGVVKAATLLAPLALGRGAFPAGQ